MFKLHCKYTKKNRKNKKKISYLCKNNINYFTMMKIGDHVPELLGRDQDGKEIRLSDFKGKKLVIYFYPKDSTPSCTSEACNLRDNYERLMQKGYAVIGVSVQDERSHKKFIEKHQLPFPLIADTEHTLVETFGVWGEKTLAGRKYMGTFRSTFVTDEHGIITEVYGPKQIKVKEHAEQILGTEPGTA